MWSTLLALAPAAILGAHSAVAGVVISEVHYHPPSSDPSWLEFVEVHNTGPEAVPLDGWRLQNGVEFTFPEATVLPPGGYLAVCKDRVSVLDSFGGNPAAFLGDFSGSLDNAGDRVELVDRFNALVDVVDYDDRLPWPEKADGQGGSLERICMRAASWDPFNWTASKLPTPGAPGDAARCPPPSPPPPRVVLSEVHYRPRSDGSVHAATGDGEEEEFVELHNPGAAAVELSGWSLVDGVDFNFPPDTVLPPGGYLAVCRNHLKVREVFGIDKDHAIGDYLGQLSNGGERVALLDFDGSWVDSVRYADSGEWHYGADGMGRSLERVSPALPASDPASWRESRAGTQSFMKLSGEGGLGLSPQKRVLISLNGPGEMLVDNLVVEDLARPGVNLLANGSFERGLEGWTPRTITSRSASAPGQGVGGSGALLLRSDGYCLEPQCDSPESVVSPLLPALPSDARLRITVEVRHLKGSIDFRAGLFGGAQAWVRQVATPGAPNSAASDDEPLFITGVNRFPQEPRPSDSTWITARVRPEDARVELRYEAAGQGAVVLAMADDGLHRDGGAGDGVFGAELPAFPHNTQVRFLIRAERGGGVLDWPPLLTPGSTLPGEPAGYYVHDELQVPTSLPVYHLLLDGLQAPTPDNVNRFLHCTELRTGSFAYRGDLYPGVGHRFRGNTACVIYKRNFKVVFNRGRYFRGLRKLNLNGIYTDKAMVREHLAWEFLKEIGTPYCQTEYARMHVNGVYFGLFLYVEHPDRRFLQRNGLDATGNLYKAANPGFVEEKPIGVAPHPSLAEYRFFWEAETNEDGDFTDLASFIDDMHADGSPPAEPTHAFWGNKSLEEMNIGYQLGQVVLNNYDSFAKNHFLYHDLETDRWGFLPWDLDLVFGKFFDPDAVGPGRPVGTLNDLMLSDPQIQGDLTPWFAAQVEQDQLCNHVVDYFFRAGGGYYQHAYLVRLWSLLEEKYKNEVYDVRLDRLQQFLKDENDLDYNFWGRYPTNVPGYPEDMPRNITIIKRQLNLHRRFLENYIRGLYQEVVQQPRVRFTEVMYWPEGGNEDLEFLELENLGPGTADLSGWSTSGVAFTFPPGTRLAEGDRLVVARSPDDLRARHAGRPLFPIFGPYTGRLANEGEELRLLDAGPGHPATVDYLRYGHDEDGWPRVEPGRSLELIEARIGLDNDDPARWRTSVLPGGTPYAEARLFIRTDSNNDHTVDVSDGVFMLQYLFLGGQAPACLDAGDSDDDGVLAVNDPIYLFNHLFLGGPAPRPPYPAPGVDSPSEDNLSCRA